MMAVVFLSVIISIPFRKYPATRLLFAVVFGMSVLVGSTAPTTPVGLVPCNGFCSVPVTRVIMRCVFPSHIHPCPPGACVSVLVMDGFLDKRYPPSWSLQAVVYACNCLASIFAVFTYWPTPRTPTYLPGVYVKLLQSILLRCCLSI